MSETYENQIAIVGISLKFPGANTPAEFWQNMVLAHDSGKIDPCDENKFSSVGLDREKHPDFVARHYSLEDIDLFDAEFFNMTPREARLADPQLRLILEKAYECFEDAGYNLSGESVGVYLGVAENKYWLFHSIYEKDYEEEQEIGKRIYVAKDYFATQLSNRFNLTGPSISLSSACSSALLAVHEACNHLLLFDCDYALAGGCELVTEKGYVYSEGGLRSRDGYVRPFDSKASGTNFGSGLGFVLLKRLKDALESKDNIYATVKSTAANNDGNRKVSYVAPSVQGQVDVIRAAISRAGLSARQIGYVEAHGTGTPVGDPIEIEALSKVFREFTDDTQFCGVGSVKANVGHLSVAAGIAGLIKTALILKNGKIPQLLHFCSPNKNINFENSPFYVVDRLMDWEVKPADRNAGVSAFGVGGTNVHAIVGAAPEPSKQERIEERPWIVPISAKSCIALKEVGKKLKDRLEVGDVRSISDVAYTLGVGRRHFEYRYYFVAEDINSLILQLDGYSGQSEYVGYEKAKRSVVFMFPGQGNQSIGMAKGLYQKCDVYREHVDNCFEVVKRELGFNLEEVFDPTPDKVDYARGLIDQTSWAQLCTFVVSYSLAQTWISWGIRPNAMIGHGIGEFVAACLANVVCLADAIKIIARRGELMQGMESGSMLSISASADEVAPYLKGELEVAAYNSPNSIVVSGRTKDVEALKETLRKNSIACSILNTSHAFHSFMMEEASSKFYKAFEGCNLGTPRIPFISSVTGDYITASMATDAKYWCDQMRLPVRFFEGLRNLASSMGIVCLEVGPGTSLTAFARRHEELSDVVIAPRIEYRSNITLSDKLDRLGKLWQLGINPKWANVYEKCSVRRVSLPGYPFQGDRYWLEERKNQYVGTNANNTPFQVESKHPLLGYCSAKAKNVLVFENELSCNNPDFLQDHKLIETVIFPGAAYVQIAVEAGRKFFGCGEILVSEILFLQAMILPLGEMRAIQTVVSSQGENECWFDIYSRATGQTNQSNADAWILHSKGKMSAVVKKVAIEATSKRKEIAELVKNLKSVKNLYENLEFVRYGETFRGVKGMVTQGAFTAGHVVLPERLADRASEYSVHPVLLDCAFQVMDGLGTISQANTLPVGLKNLTLYKDLPSSLYVICERKTDPAEPNSLGSFALLSDAGEVLASADGYVQQEAYDEIMSENDVEGLSYSIQWEAIDVGNNVVKAEKAWLIVGRNEVAAQLCDVCKNLDVQFVNVGELSELAMKGKDAEIGYSTSSVIREETIYKGIAGNLFEKVIFLSTLDKPLSPLELSTKLLELVKVLVKAASDSPPQLCLVTEGAQTTGHEENISERTMERVAASVVWGMGNSIVAEYPEFACRRIDLDPVDSSVNSAKKLGELAFNSFNEDQIAVRRNSCLVPRLARVSRAAGSSSSLNMPSGKYEIILSEAGSFDNFRAKALVREYLNPNEVRVDIRATALNFKETLYALGMLKQIGGTAKNIAFGMEAAGVITEVGASVERVSVGDNVIVWRNGCMRNELLVNSDSVVLIPKKLDFVQAACIPTVYLTAYYALRKLAKLKEGEKILIHACAGGVGLVAQQVARGVGANVYATASQPKWGYLRSIGIDKLYDSRTLEFADQILKDTGGSGVDVVLNSLNGEFIQRSFDVLGENGRFVEIGKKEIWDKSKAESYRKDVNYMPFELGEGECWGDLGVNSPVGELMECVLGDLESGKLVSLPTKTFSADNIAQAYRYLASGGNIGKVVVKHEVRGERVRDGGPAFFRADASYVVSGGLGALGFATAEWLIEHGAKSILLFGRSKISSDRAEKVNEYRERGIAIEIYRVDVSDFCELEAAFGKIKLNAPPIKGIFHCAGVLRDATISQQNSESLKSCFSAKVDGTRNLHELSKGLDLEYFVCFSSISAIMDGGGQFNYAAANAFMDELVNFRRANKLAGLSINWGGWANIGMAAEPSMKGKIRESSLLRKKDAFNELMRALREDHGRVVICKLGARLTEQRYATYLSKINEPTTEKGGSNNLTELDIICKNAEESPLEDNVKKFLRRQVSKSVGIEDENSVADDRSFIDLGIDSLAIIELKNNVQNGSGLNIRVNDLVAHPTINELSIFVKKLVGSKSSNGDAFESDKVRDGNDSCFVSFNKELEGTTLLCFPGINDNSFEFNELIPLVNHPVQVTKLGNIPGGHKIRDIARQCVRDVLKKGANDFGLVGYSYGGVVALEVASQLKREGVDVKFVLMLDSHPFFKMSGDHNYEKYVKAIIIDSIAKKMDDNNAEYQSIFHQLMEIDWSSEKYTNEINEIAQKESFKSVFDSGFLHKLQCNISHRLDAAYDGPVDIGDVRICFVKAVKQPTSVALANLGRYVSSSKILSSDCYDWESILSSKMFERVEVNCTHNEMLNKDNAQLIARLLSDLIYM